MVLGYSHDMLGYVPSRAEYAHGGYEVDVAHRHFERPARVAPATATRLADPAVEALNQVFPTAG